MLTRNVEMSWDNLAQDEYVTPVDLNSAEIEEVSGGISSKKLTALGVALYGGAELLNGAANLLGAALGKSSGRSNRNKNKKRRAMRKAKRLKRSGF